MAAAIHNLEQQLTSLPLKVRKPLQGLLAVQHINPEVASRIIEAGRLAGDNSKLLGFAVSYYALRAQNVPVDDVISMAKTQQRRINLGWTPKRWHQEHNRLSRAATLQRLAADNVNYDITKYQKYLPTDWPGYLIKNSRRLGMEGLRQSHCVASYHNQIISGSCAIATAFIQQQRWTVQLILTGDDESPLQITQIKSRYNQMPKAAERDAIYAAMNIKQLSKQSVDSVAVSQRSYLENLRRVLPVLQALGVETVTVRFDGCGDSGAIDVVDFEPDIDNPNIEVSIFDTVRSCDNGIWLSTQQLVNEPLMHAIETITNDYLEYTDVDWYNNDGGFGEMTIDVPEGTVAMDVNVRYTESNTEFCSTIDIITGDVVD